MDKNPCFHGVTSPDVTQLDGSEFADAVVGLEYLVEKIAVVRHAYNFDVKNINIGKNVTATI
jgi:hypothetical protein